MTECKMSQVTHSEPWLPRRARGADTVSVFQLFNLHRLPSIPQTHRGKTTKENTNKEKQRPRLCLTGQFSRLFCEWVSRVAIFKSLNQTKAAVCYFVVSFKASPSQRLLSSSQAWPWPVLHCSLVDRCAAVAGLCQVMCQQEVLSHFDSVSEPLLNDIPKQWHSKQQQIQ